MYPPEGASDEASARLTRTSHAQPALFVIEYALARLWMSWGIEPAACLGHSIGEFVAACLADVMPLADALRLVALRGRLMEQMPPGVMLAVPLPEEEVSNLLQGDLWLAAVNAPSSCVVSGTDATIDRLDRRLREDGVECQRLHTSHAFHSGLMDAAVAPFVAAVRQVALNPPRRPYISNVSGTWVTEEEATDPAYWGRQIREPVRFSNGISELLKNDDRVFLEVGPGQALTGLVRRHDAQLADKGFASLRRAQEAGSDVATVLAALGRLWTKGVKIDWSSFYQDERRRRVPLPTYPFERQRYWVGGAQVAAAQLTHAKADRSAARVADVNQWFYVPTWTRAAVVRAASQSA
jgi:acyl transferase domain-containing protein